MKNQVQWSRRVIRRWCALSSWAVVAATLLGTTVSGAAQAPQDERPVVRLTIKRAVEMAIQHNRQLALARLSTADSREKVSIAKSLYFPHISNDSSALYLTDLQGIVLPAGALAFSPSTGLVPSQTIRIGQGAQETFTSGTGLVQPLTQLLKVREGDKAAQADLKAAEITEDDTANSVALLVYKLYFAILVSQSQLRAGEAAMNASQSADAESQRKVAEGRALNVVSLKSHVALLDQQQSVLKTKIALEDTMLQLDDTLGLPIGTKLELDSNMADVDPQLPSRTDALASIRTHSPKVLEAEQTVEKAKAGLAAARAAYIPNITGTARYSYQSGVPFLLHNFGTFGGVVSFDLFDGGAREAKVREAKIQLQMAQNQLDSVESETKIAVMTAFDEVEQLNDLVDVEKQALEAKKEASRIAEERLSQNAAMPSEVAQTRAEAASQETSLLQTELALILHKDGIIQALGDRP